MVNTPAQKGRSIVVCPTEGLPFLKALVFSVSGGEGLHDSASRLLVLVFQR